MYFCGIGFIEDVEGYLVDEEVTDDLISARVSLVNQIRSIVRSALIRNELFQNLWQIILAKIERGMLVCCEII